MSITHYIRILERDRNAKERVLRKEEKGEKMLERERELHWILSVARSFLSAAAGIMI